MSTVLIIGAGGVSSVTTNKCAMLAEVFPRIVLASRREQKCRELADAVKQRTGRDIETATVDADNVAETVALIRRIKPDLLVHLALPYQDLTLMEACLEAGVNYLDTANYESPDVAHFEYGPQWALHDRFRDAGLMALLGSGFDPGVTSVFCTYAQKHLFDEIHTIDILDANAGEHGQAFATNFNPEINIREVTAEGRYWQEGQWKDFDALSVRRKFTFPDPDVGERTCCMMYHEELESLAKFIPHLKQARFWMTFGEEYLTHLRVLENIGMTRIDAVNYEGKEIIPLKFLKAVLPEPSSLGENYTGKTCIGCILTGIKDGKRIRRYIYNICDHAECFREVGAQAVSYTTGVPAMIGAKLMLEGTWTGKGVFNIEQLDPDPFMDDLNRHGLPWTVVELDPDADLGLD